jgi:hypothetical protein
VRLKADGASVAALACIALAARLVPLTFSSLPFSVDGFTLARVASDIAARGAGVIDAGDVNSYNMKLPGFSLLWAGIAQLAGLSPLRHVQLVLPMITCLTVLPAYLIGIKTTGRRLGGFASGLFVALFGSFLLHTSASAKESIALLVFPVAVLLFQERGDRRKRALAVILLLFLPFLHALTAFLTLGMIAALVVLQQRRALHRGRFSAKALVLDVITGPALAVPALVYYLAVDLPFLSEVLAPASFGLFIAIVVLLTALIGPAARRPTRRIGRRLVSPAARTFIPPLVGVLVVVGNSGRGLFVGAAGTQPALLGVLPVILLIAALAVIGLQLLRRTTNRMSDVVVSMLIAPTALILFGLLRGLDATGLTLVYRSFDFMDYAFAALVAVAFVAAWRGLRRLRPARGLLAAGFLATLLATTPIAWDTPAVFGVQNVTTPEEFQALALLASLGARNVTTDERLASVGAWWFGYSTDPLLPIALRENQTVLADYALLLERWTTVGAQLHPAPNVVLSRETIDQFLDSNRLVYATGPPGDRIFVVQILQ